MLTRRALAIFGSLIVASIIHAQQPEATPPIPIWEEEIAKGYLPYHQLTTKDFPIDDTTHPQMAYWVQPFAHYYYHFISRVSPGGIFYVNVTDWTVHSGFDKNLSSRNSRFTEMKKHLPYIQALLDISDLHARYLAALKAGELPSAEGRTFEEARAKLQSQVDAMVKGRVAEADKETKAFMKVTNNGQDQKKVRIMAEDIRKRLAAAPTPVPMAMPAMISPVPSAPGAPPVPK